AIDWNAVGHWAQERGVAYTSFAELSQKPAVYDLIGEVIGKVNTVLPEAVRVCRYVNLHKEFDPDDGEVTRTRKLRRSVIEDHYRDIIDAVYAGQHAIESEAQIT